MRALFIAVLAVIATAEYVAITPEDETTPVLSVDAIRQINRQDLGWIAAHNDRFFGVNIAEAKRMMGSPISSEEPLEPPVLHESNLPDHFDARSQWRECIHAIRDQGKCGSCWAFGATEALSDRFCIKSNGTVNVILSPQALVSCDIYGNLGCNGGIPQLAWEYMQIRGIPKDDCVPYISGKDGKNHNCPHACKDGSSIVRYHGKQFTQKTYNGVEAIQNAVFNDGPVEGTMNVYDDFMSYKSGVYVKSAGARQLGGHAIKILGWGTDTLSQKDYWLVANSWSETWGEKGYFKIQRGTNMCGIDRDAVAAQARID